MIELIEKKVERVQLENVTLEYLCHFYKDEISRETVLMVYDRELYVTNISYEEVLGCYDEKELVYFLRVICKEKSVREGVGALQDAEALFAKNHYIRYVFVKSNEEIIGEKAFFYTNFIWTNEVYQKDLAYQKDLLQKEGIHTFFIRIPQLDEMQAEVRHTEWKLGKFLDKINWSKARETEMKMYLNRFTDLDYDTAKSRLLQPQKQCSAIGEASRTIFLVGACIVGGWETLPGQSLGDILYDWLERKGLDYKIVKVVVVRTFSSKRNAVLEYDIKKNDIVLFIDDMIEKEVADLDLAYVYNHYTGDKWLYSDIPMHTTQVANELIAREIIKNIIEPIWVNQ